MRLSKSVATALTGIILIVFGLGVLIFVNYSFRDCTVTASATVIENVMKESTDSDNETNTYYFPVVEYMDGNKKIQAEYSIGTGTVHYDEGELVEIKYDPDNTNNFRILGDDTFTYVSYGLIALGSIILLWKLVPVIIYFTKKQ